MPMVDGFDLPIIRFTGASAFEATSINISNNNNNNNNFQA